MTETERKLWNIMKGKQINNLQFYRQRPLGKYIVDFYCPAKNLVVEIDGGQHYFERNIQKDKERDLFLKNVLGLKVLRFTNTDVLKNIEGVVAEILRHAR
jgi:very-short-patch-repair endonuclease